MNTRHHKSYSMNRRHQKKLVLWLFFFFWVARFFGLAPALFAAYPSAPGWGSSNRSPAPSETPPRPVATIEKHNSQIRKKYFPPNSAPSQILPSSGSPPSSGLCSCWFSTSRQGVVCLFAHCSVLSIDMSMFALASWSSSKNSVLTWIFLEWTPMVRRGRVLC